MPKTDKELTVEIVCAHINAWGTQDGCTPLTDDDLPSLIENIYNTIHSLDENK